MKTLLLALSFVLAALPVSAAETAAAPPTPSVAKDSRCFELRTYTALPGRLEALNARFRDHTSALFQKHGIGIVGFWMPTDAEQGATNKLVYLLVHQSREAAKKSWDAFRTDPEWNKARTESEASGRIVEKVESVYLSATDYSPMK